MNNMTKKTGFYTVILFMTIGFSSPVLSQNPVDDFFLGQTINNLGALAGPGSRQDRLDDFGRRSLNTLGEALMYSSQIQAQKEIAEAGRPQQNIYVNTNNTTRQYVEPQVQRYFAPKPEGNITGLKVSHNQQLEGGKRGMVIQASISVHNLKGIPVEIVVFFKRKACGRYLSDLDGAFCNVNRLVCTYTKVIPPYDDTDYSRIQISIPYEQLHLPSGRYIDLVGEVSLVDQKASGICLDQKKFYFYYQ